MYPAFEILATIIAFTFVIIITYGVFTRQRDWFALGLCCFNIIPVAGELYNYSLDNKLLHVAIIMVFIPQIITTLPVKANYGSDNASAFALGRKIGLSVLVTNLLHGCFILGTALNVPHQFGYFHIVVALIMLYTIVKSNNKEGIHWK